MPVIDSIENGKPVKRYRWPAQYVTPTEDMYDRLSAWRKIAIQMQEYCTQQQKLYGHQNREIAKFFKEESRRFLRQQRAVAYHMPWICGPVEKEGEVPPQLWPIDLAEELDYIAGMLVLGTDMEP